MRQIDKCSKCGSGSVTQRAMVVDRTDSGELEFHLRVDAKPSAMVFKNSVRSALYAFVCASCGYVEFYADDAKELYDAFLAAQQNSPQIT